MSPHKVPSLFDQGPSSLSFERGRWSVDRTLNVSAVLSYWTENPSRVRIFDDPRLGEAKLVMMRKDVLEELLNRLRDLSSGCSAIEVEVNQATKAIATLKDGFVDSGLLNIPGSKWARGLTEVAVEHLQKLQLRFTPAASTDQVHLSELPADAIEFNRRHGPILEEPDESEEQ